MNPSNPTLAKPRSRRKTAVALALAALAVLALPTFAYAASHRPAGRTPTALERVAQRLDLSQDQIDQIRRILAGHKEELAAEIGAVTAARRNLFDTIHGETFDETAIRRASAAVGAAETELAVTRGGIVQEVRTVLTPEQQEELAQMLDGVRAFVASWIQAARARFDALGV